MIYKMNQQGMCKWEINIHPVTHSNSKKTLALVSVVVGDILHLRGIRIVEHEGEVKVIYPSYLDHNKNFKDFFYVGDGKIDREIRSFMIQCYLNQKGDK